MQKFLRDVGYGISVWGTVCALLWSGFALADYYATQGAAGTAGGPQAAAGTTYASGIISNIHYQQMMLCDALLGKTNCASVKGSNTPAAQTDLAVVSRNPDIGAAGTTASCTPAAMSTLMGCQYAMFNLLNGPLASNGAPTAWIGNTGDIIVNPVGNLNLAQNSFTYARGQLVANSTTATSVVPLSWVIARVNGGNFYLRRFRMYLQSRSISNTNFRLHLYNSNGGMGPTVVNGDGMPFQSTVAYEFCTLDTFASATDPMNWEVGSDFSVGYGVPAQGVECAAPASAGYQNIYGLIESLGTYQSGPSNELVYVTLEGHQN